MVEHGNFNEAFTKALMASDLPVVVDLMEMVEQNKIFSSDLPNGTALEEKRHKCLIKTPPLSQSDSVSPTEDTPSIDTSLSSKTRSTMTPSPIENTNASKYYAYESMNQKGHIPPVAPPKPSRTVSRIQSVPRNGYFADSEETLDRKKIKLRKNTSSTQSCLNLNETEKSPGYKSPIFEKNYKTKNKLSKHSKSTQNLADNCSKGQMYQSTFNSIPESPCQNEYTKKSRSNYDSIANQIISGADDFFNSGPERFTPRPHSKLDFTQTQLESDTEARLEQFFLINKY